MLGKCNDCKEEQSFVILAHLLTLSTAFEDAKTLSKKLRYITLYPHGRFGFGIIYF